MTTFIETTKVFPSTFCSVFNVLSIFANHKSENDALDAYVAFTENDEESYVFENTMGETYKLTHVGNVFSLGFPENDFSGDPAVVEAANRAFTALS